MSRVSMGRGLLTATLLTVAVATQAKEPLQGAERTWVFYCQGCHESGTSEHPGTLRLSHTRGEGKAAIRGRKDLHPDYIRQVVRQGYLEMVGFRNTEITDEALDELIRYIREE